MDPLTMGMGILGLGANLFGQSRTNDMQQQMMAQQQSFQERMSSTAYQRASEDMTKAGLNPMMMFSSGSAASTPAGVTPSPNVKSGVDSESMQRAISTATQMKVANATINNLVEQNAKIKAEVLTEKERPLLVANEAGLRANQMGLVRADTRVTNTRGDILRNEAVTAKNQEEMNPTARKILDVGGFAGRKASDIVSPVGEVISSARRARSLFSDRFYY